MHDNDRGIRPAERLVVRMFWENEKVLAAVFILSFVFGVWFWMWLWG